MAIPAGLADGPRISTRGGSTPKLTRAEGAYRVAEADPERDANETQEVPPFEAEILARIRARRT